MVGIIIMLCYCIFTAKNAKIRGKSQAVAYLYTIVIWQIFGWIGGTISISLIYSKGIGIALSLFIIFFFLGIGAFISYKISTIDPIIDDSNHTEFSAHIINDKEAIYLNDDEISSSDTSKNEMENNDDVSTL
ncbi:MAG: hypothetical protein LBT51_09180 [Fusobacteriaceae bacterium]|jgi:hypothetical protein|nr:hypothetical protein [Fusobacteriaceae bacterium]